MKCLSALCSVELYFIITVHRKPETDHWTYLVGEGVRCGVNAP